MIFFNQWEDNAFIYNTVHFRQDREHAFDIALGNWRIKFQNHFWMHRIRDLSNITLSKLLTVLLLFHELFHVHAAWLHYNSKIKTLSSTREVSG